MAYSFTCEGCGKIFTNSHAKPRKHCSRPCRTIGNDAKRGKRFWDKVKIGAPNECWEWQGWVAPTGYGRFYSGENNRTNIAHRMAYELTNNVILPKNVYVCHHCDNRKCCNPAHLFEGTHQDNMNDMHAKGRYAGGDRHSSHLYPEMAKERFNKAREKYPDKFRKSGEEHPNAKFTNEQANYIRKAYADGAKTIQLAKRFGISRGTIYNIVKFHTYPKDY